MQKTKNLIPVDKCIKGRIYKLRCRNLSFGVYDGNGGFIGIRTKFNDRYLFTEYHKDISKDFGTVFGMIDTGVDVPKSIKLKTSMPTIDKNSGRKVKFEFKKGWMFKDTGEYSKDIYPISYINNKLFTFLEKSTTKPSWRM